MKYRMKVKEVIKAATENRYILLRVPDGRLLGCNSVMVLKRAEASKKRPSDKSHFIGFIPASLNEYINHKIPFI